MAGREGKAEEDARGQYGGRHTIDECVEDVVPVLLNQVVDVTEDTAVQVVVVSLCLGESSTS